MTARGVGADPRPRTDGPTGPPSVQTRLRRRTRGGRGEIQDRGGPRYYLGLAVPPKPEATEPVTKVPGTSSGPKYCLSEHSLPVENLSPAILCGGRFGL